MIQMFIGGEEVVCSNEMTVTEELLATSSTILNNCYPKSWETNQDYVSNFYYPLDYSLFELYQNGNLIFAGLVKNTGEISLNPFEPKYCSLQVLDFKTLLSEGETLEFVISNKTITEAIQQVVDAVSDYGFVLGNVSIKNPNEIIGAYSTLNKTAYDVFQYLADISESKWFTRMVDKDTTAIDFYDPDLLPRADDLEYNQTYWEQNSINSIKFSYGTYDYRNKQTILSSEVYADIDYNEQILSDGYTTTFTTQANIGVLNSILVNGNPVTFSTNNDKEIGIETDFYYSAGSNQLELNENLSYTAGTEITVNYVPLVQGRQIVYNQNEVTRIANQINRKGVISRYEDRNDILSSTELNQIAQTYIKYKGSAEITLTVETLNNNIYDVGQVVYFNAPIPNLAKDYLVKKKDMQIITAGDTKNIFYTYELSSSFNSERAINWFDNQRTKANGNISTGEYITRNIDIENSANIIFDNLTVTSLNVTNNNVLNATLNATLNN